MITDNKVIENPGKKSNSVHKDASGLVVSASAITLIDKNRMFIGMHVHIDTCTCTCACTLHDPNFDSVCLYKTTC